MCRSNGHPLFCVCFLGTWGVCLSTLNLRYFHHHESSYSFQYPLYYSLSLSLSLFLSTSFWSRCSCLVFSSDFLFVHEKLSFQLDIDELLCHAQMLFTPSYAKTKCTHTHSHTHTHTYALSFSWCYRYLSSWIYLLVRSLFDSPTRLTDVNRISNKGPLNRFRIFRKHILALSDLSQQVSSLAVRRREVNLFSSSALLWISICTTAIDVHAFNVV